MNAQAQDIFSQLTAKPNPAVLTEVTELFRRCESAVNDGEGDIEPLLNRLEVITGKRWTPDFFFELWGWTSPEDLAELWAVPAPKLIQFDEETLAGLLELALPYVPSDKIWGYLQQCLGPAFNTDLIYYPYREMNAKELAAEVFARKEILTSRGDAGLTAYERDIAEKILTDKDAKVWSRQWAKGVVS